MPLIRVSDMKRGLRACLLALALALPTTLAAAEVIEGRVVAVGDGDTLVVLDFAMERHHVRLAGIDAPEKRQAYGDVSRENLARMALGKDAWLDCHQSDRDPRQTCKVWVQPADCPQCGKTLDAGLAQLTVGLAWHDKRHAYEQRDEDRGRYSFAEYEARARRVGLWRERDAVPPWEWRRRNAPVLRD